MAAIGDGAEGNNSTFRLLPPPRPIFFLFDGAVYSGVASPRKEMPVDGVGLGRLTGDCDATKCGIETSVFRESSSMVEGPVADLAAAATALVSPMAHGTEAVATFPDEFASVVVLARSWPPVERVSGDASRRASSPEIDGATLDATCILAARPMVDADDKDEDEHDDDRERDDDEPAAVANDDDEKFSLAGARLGDPNCFRIQFGGSPTGRKLLTPTGASPNEGDGEGGFGMEPALFSMRPRKSSAGRLRFDDPERGEVKGRLSHSSAIADCTMVGDILVISSGVTARPGNS